MWAPKRWGNLAASDAMDGTRLTRRLQRGSFPPIVLEGFPPPVSARKKKKKRPETWRFGSLTAIFFGEDNFIGNAK